MKKILLIYFVISVNLFTQYDLRWITPKPVYESINDIKILNENTAIAVGENGLIMRTDDSGSKWNIINRNENNIYYKLYFTDFNLGYLYGKSLNNEEYFLLKTTNIGFNWFDLKIQNLNPILDIYFLNNNSGFISFFGNYYLKTNNGGETWDSIAVNLWNHPNSLNQIYFINADTGFISAATYDQYYHYGKLIKTTDSGFSWNFIYNDTGNYYNNIHFFNDQTGYMIKNFDLMKTTNSGESWFIFRNLSGYVSYGFQKFKFVSENEILLSTDYYYWNRINKTTDAGLTWSYSKADGLSIDCIDIHNNFALAGGSFGNLIKSSNFGNNWTNYNQTYSEMNNSFADNNGRIFIAGDYGNLYKSTNYGEEWINIKLYEDTVQSYLSPKIYFLNNNTGFYFGGLCRFYRTTNDGNTWIRLFDTCTAYTSNNYRNLYFIDQNTGFLSGERYTYGYSLKTLYKTTDAGLNWDEIGTDVPYSDKSIFFEDENTGYIGNYYGLWKTINGGLNWTNINNNGEFGNCYYQNKSHFFRLDNNKLYKSTDSGLNWDLLYQSDTYEVIKDFCYIGLNLYLLIENQTYLGYTKIAKSVNYGVTWSTNHVAQRLHLNKIQMFNDYSGYLFGSFGRLLKISDLSNGQNPPLLNYNFLLNQNYPNPFNPVTTLSYEIPNTEYTTLKLFNILGREVKVIVNQIETAGKHQLEYNFSDIASGIYFLQLRQGQFSQSRKIVLIK